MALGIQQGAGDQRSASGADREALGEERHGQAPVLQRGFLDHGFGGSQNRVLRAILDPLRNDPGRAKGTGVSRVDGLVRSGWGGSGANSAE